MKILVIEDDVMLRKAMSHFLLEKGHSVSVAGNGNEAINVVSKNLDLDIIICDVLMPELSGPSFLLMLKRHYPGGLPYIMVMSGLKDGEQFVKKLHIPCDSYFQKPVDFDVLHQAVSDFHRPTARPAAS
jgi:two-component system, cell cycle sensor histidine kinase and response regulator CckA